MFESNEKKELRNKYNKMAGIRAQTGKKMKGRFADQQHGSVYTELKLSE